VESYRATVLLDRSGERLLTAWSSARRNAENASFATAMTTSGRRPIKMFRKSPVPAPTGYRPG
jgi:hypothetical protein